MDPEELSRIDPAAGEILRRLLAQIANEAAFALEEEIASSEDMETATRLGLNWPLGSLGLAAKIGTREATALLEGLASERGGAYAPAPMLRQAAERGVELRDLR